MGFSLDDKQVEGNIFNDIGKWKYTVQLDYSRADWKNWDLWSEAANALRQATLAGTSGVTFSEIPYGWFMVVLEPYAENAHPIVVRRTNSGGIFNHTDEQESNTERFEKSARESGRQESKRDDGSPDWLFGR